MVSQNIHVFQPSHQHNLHHHLLVLGCHIFLCDFEFRHHKIGSILNIQTISQIFHRLVLWLKKWILGYLDLLKWKENLALFRMVGRGGVAKYPHNRFSHVTPTNVEISPEIFLTFRFNSLKPPVPVPNHGT